jgi:hypothetical protein
MAETRRLDPMPFLVSAFRIPTSEFLKPYTIDFGALNNQFPETSYQ